MAARNGYTRAITRAGSGASLTKTGAGTLNESTNNMVVQLTSVLGNRALNELKVGYTKYAFDQDGWFGGGFVGFAVVQASRADAAFENAEVFALLLPGLPAYAILTAALALDPA